MKIIDKILDLSLRQVLKALCGTVLASARYREKTVTDPLQRRFKGGQLKGLPPHFFENRAKELEPILQSVIERGEFDESLLLSKALGELDERVVEYPVILETLITIARSKRPQLLDAGCVLNNACICKKISLFTDMIWYMNSSLEKLSCDRNIAYVLSDMRKHTLPDNLRFDLVTCLSTLEHVGMNNERYGGCQQEFDGMIDNPHLFAIEAAQSIIKLVAPNGIFMLSVPYGPFEYLYSYGNLSSPIYYTFDEPRLIELAESLTEFNYSINVFKVIPHKGWVKTSMGDKNILKHAEQCAGAGAVAFIKAVRQD